MELAQVTGGITVDSVPDTTSRFEELDYRVNGGIEVSLLWSRIDNSICVFVCDTKTLELLEIPVCAAEAKEAFEHPFAYAPSRRLEVASPRRP